MIIGAASALLLAVVGALLLFTVPWVGALLLVGLGLYMVYFTMYVLYATLRAIWKLWS